MGESCKASICCIQALFFCLIASFLSSAAHAEGRVISLQGGCIAPSAPSDSIRLDEINVTFRSKRDSYSVNAYYRLFNTDKTTKVKVGVPKYGRPDRDEPTYFGELIVRDFIEFAVSINGRKVEFIEVSDFYTDPSARPVGGYCRQRGYPTETRWMMKEVTFKGKATTTIHVYYEAYYHNTYFHSGILYEEGRYHDSVGRYWKKKIEKAIFVNDITDIKGAVCPWTHFLGREAALSSFISVDQIMEWEPLAGSFQAIPGSWAGAKLRVGAFLGPSGYTPCDSDLAKRLRKRSVR
jgi:hypothetical protein